MRIGLDCRKIDDFGIGTYIRGLLSAMPEIYVAFGPARIALPSGVEHVIVDAPHYSLRELFAVGRAADAARLDLFHAPHYVVPQMHTPVVVTIHDLIHLRRPLPQRLYARSMLRRAVRRSRAVLTVSDAARSDIERELGARHVTVTSNGVDEIFFDQHLQPARRDLPYFLFVGNDKPHKNVDRLAGAFAQLGLPAQLILAGAPFERFRDRQRVVCAGFVEQRELAALYRGAAALVIPSIEEGFGLPAAEAMACGTAVITSTAKALVEITADAALHVDAQDTAAIAGAMRTLLHDAALRATLIARGKQRASHYTWTACAQKTRATYEAAMQKT